MKLCFIKKVYSGGFEYIKNKYPKNIISDNEIKLPWDKQRVTVVFKGILRMLFIIPIFIISAILGGILSGIVEVFIVTIENLKHILEIIKETWKDELIYLFPIRIKKNERRKINFDNSFKEKETKDIRENKFVVINSPKQVIDEGLKSKCVDQKANLVEVFNDLK